VIVAVRVVGRELPICRDLVVRTGPGHTVADLCERLGDHLGVAVPGLIPQRTGRPLPAPRAVEASGLLNGDLLMIGAEADHVLDVVAGSNAGTSFPVMAGRWVIGRGAAADVSLADVTVSRRHAALEITTNSITVTPFGAVRVNGAALDLTNDITPGDVISLGGSELVLRTPQTAPDRRAIRDGTVEFRRTPYRRPVAADREAITIGPIPERHEPRRMQMLSIAGPLLAGLVLFAFMHRVEFLALTLLSPVLLIATTIDDRRAGRRRHRRQIASFRSMLDDRRRELLGLGAAERSERLAAAPDLTDLARRAERTAIDLWPRGRAAEDFLRLRVGRGALPARFDAALAPGGDPDLRAEAVAAVTGTTTLTDVPITVDVAGEVIALQGGSELVDGVLTSLVLQAACLHPPEALSIAAILSPDRNAGWINWLPHARHAPVACSRAEAETLVRALLDDARRRADDDTGPHVLVVIEAGLVRGVAAAAALLELASAARIGVVWIATHPGDVPHQASSVLELGSSVRLLTAASESIDLVVEPATHALADRLARLLAPVRDVAGGDATEIPADVALLDVVGQGATSSTTVARWWQRAATLELRVPIGVGADGPLAVDLVEDGPHMLLVGTTGSGKSELLQSMVTAVAARYSPTRVNFLFVDYKGGAATKAFEHLPHTVGYVTNLDAALARRAIVSLRAELERRMTLLEGRAKDLRELFALAPAEAPPALMIVVDEFATLAKQLPDFVAGIVDIAQRGRSLGIHLVLSTQRLAGAVDENIVANTNVRVALRVLERADSTAVVGDGAAAEIPMARRGRGVCRVGSHRPFAFQSAYGARSLASTTAPTEIAVSAFTHSGQLVEQGQFDARPVGDAATTQQQAVLDAVVAAARELGLTPSHRPWCEPLPAVVTLADVRVVGTVRAPAIGLFDAPTVQHQGPLVLDLERGGGCLIFGSGGAGKTTALRSTALALTRAASDRDPAAIVAFDGPSRGLAMLAPLPTVVDVIGPTDVEAITRHIDALDRELTRRLRALARVAADDVSAYNAVHPPIPRIVVLIDDIGSFAEALGGQVGSAVPMGEAWSERLVRVLVEGRRAGIHGVVTADRRNAVPSRLLTAVSNRIVLGFADRASYADHGVPSDAPVLHDMTPGRGWFNGTTVVQIATATREQSALGQRATIESIAATCGVAPAVALSGTRLPDRVSLRGPRCARPLATTIAVEDLTGAEVTLDLVDSHVAVVGHARSGRSTALRAIAAGLPAAQEVYAVGTATSGLAGVSATRSAFGSAAEIAALLTHVTVGADEGGVGRGQPAVLLVDDLDLLDDIALAHVWDRVAGSPNLRVAAAVDSSAMTGFTSNPVAGALKRSRQMLILQPDDPGVFLQLTGTRLESRPGLPWIPGRGVLYADRVTRIVQVAVCHDDRRRTPVRSRDSLAGVTVTKSQSTRTAAVAAPVSR
jgi:S-DNA-T family DNA segregation ATPase FtsK/SpoIIIE